MCCSKKCPAKAHCRKKGVLSLPALPPFSNLAHDRAESFIIFRPCHIRFQLLSSPTHLTSVYVPQILLAWCCLDNRSGWECAHHCSKFFFFPKTQKCAFPVFQGRHQCCRCTFFHLSPHVCFPSLWFNERLKTTLWMFTTATADVIGNWIPSWGLKKDEDHIDNWQYFWHHSSS